MERQSGPGLTYMSVEDIERTASVEMHGVVAADRHLDRYDSSATVSRIANRVVNMLLWLKPGLRGQVITQAQVQLEAYKEAAE